MFDNISTYGLNSDGGVTNGFVIKKIEDIYDFLKGIDDKPHRHDYYTLILVSKGTGKHIIDFNEFDVKDKTVHFVYPGQVHQISTPERPQGWVMNFSREFLVQNAITDKLVNRVYLYNTTGYSPPLMLSDDEYVNLLGIVNQVMQYSSKDFLYKYEALGALLKLFFININSSCMVQHSHDMEQAIGRDRLFVSFKKMLDQKFQEYHKVTQYADDLAVSSDYLNKFVKTQSGKSAKEFIQDKLLVEAKRLLLFTSQTNKELASNIGFEEPSHFSNFFKKMTSQTPGQFRKENIVR
ncbi:AraC family transcriptional regulator [Plebeiibacterium marinum]|uniref:AraC family transcriptional regulator n=1 Tax=Plebeiibacterium marinum TaxID=2992111 RepID=A0AAE3MDM6_9BACT|nr:helix-turn-helix transcriptional regulator [Plebeiobacterium marinum]MCW3806013.1 AraC family transcriptional regulator [Plebeiobacterium marinum]